MHKECQKCGTSQGKHKKIKKVNPIHYWQNLTRLKGTQDILCHENLHFQENQHNKTIFPPGRDVIKGHYFPPRKGGVQSRDITSLLGSNFAFWQEVMNLMVKKSHYKNDLLLDQVH